MKILIHTQSGSVETFFQDDPALVDPMLKGIKSTKLFATNIITITGDCSVTTFVTSQVNRVDLFNEELPLWKYPADILDVVELSEDEFRERSHLNDPVRQQQRRSPKQTSEFAFVFVEVEMTGGTRIYLAAKIRVGLPAERLQWCRALFSAAAVHFRMRQGGTAILNVKNLVRFTLNSGPDITPSDAWLAHHLSQQREPVRIADTRDSNHRML